MIISLPNKICVLSKSEKMSRVRLNAQTVYFVSVICIFAQFKRDIKMNVVINVKEQIGI